mmetsp:Transcript_11187/g.26183  ORF Transcript_11187/g.26183 Transcript_11187/m.26183 type:complete len:285 (-) Transcript_11187:789-1643(-)
MPVGNPAPRLSELLSELLRLCGSETERPPWLFPLAPFFPLESPGAKLESVASLSPSEVAPSLLPSSAIPLVSSSRPLLAALSLSTTPRSPLPFVRESYSFSAEARQSLSLRTSALTSESTDTAGSAQPIGTMRAQMTASRTAAASAAGSGAQSNASVAARHAACSTGICECARTSAKGTSLVRTGQPPPSSPPLASGPSSGARIPKESKTSLAPSGVRLRRASDRAACACDRSSGVLRALEITVTACGNSQTVPRASLCDSSACTQPRISARACRASCSSSSAA